jgi:hypothetical protein
MVDKIFMVNARNIHMMKIRCSLRFFLNQPKNDLSLSFLELDFLDRFAWFFIRGSLSPSLDFFPFLTPPKRIYIYIQGRMVEKPFNN